jgi:ubiquitin conjugation factor E4 B
MFTVMRDPVILPISRAVVDRATIKSHLLSDAKDPFNRVPLTIEDVIPSECRHLRKKLFLPPLHFHPPDTELKERIEAFLIERRNRNAAPVVGGEEDVEMDV